MTNAKWLSAPALLFVFVLALGWSLASADDPPQFPQGARFTTLVKTEFEVEGLTAGTSGNLYTAGRQVTNTQACPVYQIDPGNPVEPPPTVGLIPDPDGAGANRCNPAGIAFNNAGDLFVADSGAAATVYFFPAGTLSDTAPPMANIFATGVPGVNGIAFDRDDNLWASDGTTAQGRVWKIASCGVPPCGAVEVFRVQPMRNSNALGGDLAGDGVGRQARTFPPGTLVNTAGGQDLAANGLAFNHKGELLVADTARGAIWKVDVRKAEFNPDGTLKTKTNCDTTFTANTLCLDNIFVAHPILEGADGIALDVAGNIWVDANERNAVAVVTKDGRVAEVFRNPANAAGLRNSADPALGNNHILEFPASPFLVGKAFCTSNSDGDRRDNSPRSAGEIPVTIGSDTFRGKISCMTDEGGNILELNIPGLPLPVH
ncbi:MAG: SMP-30/gluconolactonase/LRE family protein [Deltaproteobacteria bacterium]|nr:SMP-30/gluconolactonase/LRE family protein [Deltaproteobacteria bacterium]